MKRHEEEGHQVLPVFYHVEPSDVRKHRGEFGAPFLLHERNFPKETVDKWKQAVTSAASLRGEPIKVEENRYQSHIIQQIVGIVKNQVPLKLGDDAVPKLVGRESDIAWIHRWVQDGSSSRVGVATICGIPGIGKTTIAREVYNLNFQHGFDGSCFLENVAQKSKQHGLVHLQAKLLQDLGKKTHLTNPILGEGEASARMELMVSNKRVLIVLDDVDDLHQYDRLIGKKKWFRLPGSKIIITTTSKTIPRAHECDEMFEIRPLGDDESLELLSWHAFGQDHPKPGYEKCSRDLVHYCGGLPLALHVLGSSLSDAPVGVWNEQLQKLEVNPNRKIQDVLEISYYSLADDDDKNLFLDMACFFVGVDKSYAVKVLQGCGFLWAVGVKSLMDKCLITFDGEDKLMMHQLIRDMGRDLARREPLDNPRKPRRVWGNKEAISVMTEKTDIELVRGLRLNHRIINSDSTQLDGENSSFSTEAFAKMKNLLLLNLSHVELHGQYEDIHPTLVWLRWHRFSLAYIPNDLYLGNLAVLEMPHSKLRHVWKGIMHLKLLKILDLRHSRELISTPYFKALPGLEILVLEGCVNLVKVHESIQVLEKLESLNLKDCKNISSALPVLKSLKKLNISGCSKLGMSIDVLRHFKSLKVLIADGISIKDLREAKLSLMPQLPARTYAQSTWFLFDFFPRSLTSLSLADCSLSDDSFPAEFSCMYSLKYLNLSGNPITRLPECIKPLPLDELELERCSEMQSLSMVPRKFLNIAECESLERVDNHVSLSQYSPGIYSVWCPNLTEIGDYFKLGQLGNIDREIHEYLGLANAESLVRNNGQIFLFNGLTNLAHRTTIQVSSEYGMRSVFLPGGAVPDWFHHRVEKNSISFDLLRVPGLVLKGFSLCLKYCTLDPQIAAEYPSVPNRGVTIPDPGFFGVMISNRTTRQRCRYDPIVRGIPIPGSYEDVLWLSYWDLEDFGHLLPLKEGDQVKVSGHMAGLVAKEWGIRLVYRRRTKEELINSIMSLVSGDMPEPKPRQPSPWSCIELTHSKRFQVTTEQNGYSSTLLTLPTLYK